jgi:hypothetical protein
LNKGNEAEHACWKNGVVTLYSCSSVGVVAGFFCTKSRSHFFHVHVNRPFMRPYPNPTTRIGAGTSTGRRRRKNGFEHQMRCKFDHMSMTPGANVRNEETGRTAKCDACKLQPRELGHLQSSHGHVESVVAV